MAELLIRFLVRVQPREGWARFLLALTAVLCLPAALISVRGSQAQVGGGSLMVAALLAMVLGVRLARSRATWRGPAAVAILSGVAVAAIIVGRLVPPAGVLWRTGMALYVWLRDLPRSIEQGPPLAELSTSIGQQLQILGTRLWWSGRGTGAGQVTDPVLGELLVVLLAWGCTFFAAWHIYRRQRPLLGLLPTGTALAIVAFFRGGMPVFYLFTLAFCGLWLAALQRLQRQQEGWDETGTDYPGALHIEMSMLWLPWLVAVLFLATVWPVVRLNAVRHAFWQRMDEPWSRVETMAERYVGPIDAEGALGGSTLASSAGELPRSHLLGAGPQLREIQVLRVQTSDPPPEAGDTGLPPAPAPRRYWRSTTFDTYTGQGWTNTSQSSQEVAAGAPLATHLPPGDELWQRFEIVQADGAWLYAANTPYRLDVPVRAWRRASGELVGLTGDAQSYTVISRTPVPPLSGVPAGEAGTQGADPLPAGDAALYLQLPDTVPQRVLELAERLAGAEPGSYDRAERIEAYLRRYTYKLDLPEPPRGQDLVDWFLFDLQEGYCDYYASAMVVLARAAGVPARLATGYAQGTYDPQVGAWVVSALDAHSWPEIYIEGSGWVEFEPTAGQPALDRPGETALPQEPLPPRGALRWLRDVPWSLVALALVAAGLLAALAWLWRPRPAPSGEPAALVLDRYARLLRWGRRLGHPLRNGQTVLEYGRDLGKDLLERGRSARLSGARQASSQIPAEIERLADALNRVQYAQEPLPERTGTQVQALWSRLRRWLLWLWLAGRDPGAP